MRLLLAPHAVTEWNLRGRFQGHTDVPLCPEGYLQAERLRRRLALVTVDLVFASDLSRAWDTAALAVPPQQIVRPEPRLREMHFGNWEGLTYEQIQQVEPRALEAWQANEETAAPPGGETLTAVAARLHGFLEQLDAIGEQTVLLVAHRGSLRVLLCLLLGRPPRDHWQFRLDPASITEVDRSPERTTLVYCNDTHHLQEVAHAG